MAYRWSRWVVTGFAAMSAAGCASRQPVEGGKTPTAESAAETPSGEKEQVTEFDFDGDKKPDVWSYFVEVTAADGELSRRTTRKEFDLNHDGKVDLIRVYDRKGQLERTVFDLDLDGVPNVVTFFERGLPTKKERDLDGDGKPDQFVFFEEGKQVRSERDSNADGKIDRWEYFEGDEIDRIGEDTDGDGKIDRWVKRGGSNEG
jgi:hypothetical protein